MTIKLIICDIDGTLIDNKNHNISQKNIHALLQAQKQGILVSIASGRVPSGLINYAKSLNIANYCKYIIGANGGTVMNIVTKQCYYDKFISYKDTIWAMNIVKQMNNDFYLAPINEKLAYVSSQYAIDKDIFLFHHTNNIPILINWKKIPQMRKVVIFCTDIKKQNWLKQQIKNNSLLKAELTGYGFIEIMPKNVNKWRGILKLLNILKINENIHINSNEIMCFGDAMNDYEMIKNVKYGIVMSNGVKNLKKIAKDITHKDNNNSGIADYLIKNIIK